MGSGGAIEKPNYFICQIKANKCKLDAIVVIEILKCQIFDFVQSFSRDSLHIFDESIALKVVPPF